MKRSVFVPESPSRTASPFGEFSKVMLSVMGLLLLSMFCATSVQAQAGSLNWWATDINPILNEQDGQVTDSDEWKKANWAAWTNGDDHGTYYAEYKKGWIATASNPANQMFYDCYTLFDLHDFSTAVTQDINDYNVFSYEFPNNNKITAWVLANDNDPDDTDWLNNTGGLQDSHLIPEGSGNDLIDDRGFIVRLNDDSYSDVHWFPGGLEPGDPLFDWTLVYGFFGTSGFNNSAFLRGLPNAIDGPNEIYEVAVRVVLAGEDPIDSCVTNIIRKTCDPKNGEPKIELITIITGRGHVGKKEEEEEEEEGEEEEDKRRGKDIKIESGGRGEIRVPSGWTPSRTPPRTPSQVDTFVLAEYTFDHYGQCIYDGWGSHDLTDPIGDYAGLFPGVNLPQKDGCPENPTCLWSFIKDSMYDYSCNFHPELAVVPYRNDEGEFMINEIWSPPIDLNPGGAIPPTSSSIVLEYYVYRDLKLDELVMYVWHVRSLVGGSWTRWKDSGFVYYGNESEGWIQVQKEIGALIPTGATEIQIALGVWDMARFWGGLLGSGNCHSHAPLFDNVKVYRINNAGPVFDVRDINLLQDNFPGDGTTTGTVRVDIAANKALKTVPNIEPGDSTAIRVSEPTFGLTLAGDGRAAVYCYVRSTSGGNPADWQATEAGAYTPYRYPLVGGPTSGGFYQFQMDTVYNDVSMIQAVPDKYCFDLNDGYFTPPARIDFYFSAQDLNAVTSYWTETTGKTLDQVEAEAHSMEMQCLPTGNSDILYVDDQDGRGAQIYFDTVFDLMSITPDRYDVRGPTSLVGNGLGSRAVAGQIVDVYKKIIWHSGDISAGTIGDGSGRPEKSPDAQLLYTFLETSSAWDPCLYLCGDNIANEMMTLATPPYLALFNYITFGVLSGDHVMYGLPIKPLVIGSATGLPSSGNFFQDGAGPDTLIAYGGCPIINKFDVLQALGPAVEAMYYETPGNGAVIAQTTANAMAVDARVVLSGFSFDYICDDRVTFPFDRLEHMMHIIEWFQNVFPEPTGTGDSPLATSLAQNYPNPFNPGTAIEFSLREHAHVSLKIYNVAGQLVRTLVDGELDAGVYKNFTWDGLDNNQQSVASGVYFCRMVTRQFDQTRKMVLMK